MRQLYFDLDFPTKLILELRSATIEVNLLPTVSVLSRRKIEMAKTLECN